MSFFNVLKKIGLKTAKGCCFYPVGKDSAVLVGIKYKQGKPITVPERIGKYTVRGIDDLDSSGRLYDAYAALDGKTQRAVKEKLWKYEMLSEVDVNLLPETVEYIGISKLRGIEFDTEKIEIPPQIRYIRNLQLPKVCRIPTPVLLPDTLQYLGQVSDNDSCYSLKCYSSGRNTPPHLRLSDYLGYEVKEDAQIADGAFRNCQSLMVNVELPKGITRIGEGAFESVRMCTVSIPEGVTYIGSGAFANCVALKEFNLPDSLTYLAVDAFSNCPRLCLTPSVLKQLERYPMVYEQLVPKWKNDVQTHLKSGNDYLFVKHLTVNNKASAFDEYYQALMLDPYCMPAILGMERVILSCQTPNNGIVPRLEDVKAHLEKHGNLDALHYFNGSIAMLDDICVIMSYEEDIITMRQVYGLNHDQAAAAAIMKFLLDALEKHPRTTVLVKNEIYHFIGWMLKMPTRNKDSQSEKCYLYQKQRYLKMFGREPDYLELGCFKLYLHSKDLMDRYNRAMEIENDEGFYDAEFWLELARTLNPGIEIPKEFVKMQSRHRAKEEAERWRRKMAAIAFPPTPVLPVPSFGYSEENSFRMDEIVSEYWAEVAARAEAQEIENMWYDLSASGFWDDTSWQ